MRNAPRLVIGLSSAVAALLLAAVPTLAADRTVIPAEGPPGVVGPNPIADFDVLDGTLVWATSSPVVNPDLVSPNTPVDDAQALALHVRRRGVTREVPVAPIIRDETQESRAIDLGRSKRGVVYAVYERCTLAEDSCNLFKLNLATLRERKLRAISRAGRNEFEATYWAGRYVFRRARAGAGIAPDGPLFKFPRLRELTRTENAEDPDLRRTRVAFSPQFNANVVVKRFRRSGRGRNCRVDRDPNSRLDFEADNPQLQGRHVYWTAIGDNTEDRGGDIQLVQLLRRRLPTARCRQRSDQRPLRTFSNTTQHVVVDGRRVYYLDGGTIYQATDPAPSF